MFKNQALEQQISPCYGYFLQQANLCYGIWSNEKTHAMVLRAARKLMLLFSLEPNTYKALETLLFRI